MSAHVAAPDAASRARHTGCAVALLLAGAGLHLLYLLIDCPLDLSGDEAHYWEWARRLDWSYYSKGPLVAWIIAGGRVALAGLSRALLGDETLAVRGPALLLSVLSGLGIYVLALRTLDSSRLALAAVALTFTIPILAVGAILMTIDAPLACLFVWALVAVEAGLRTGASGPWLVAGLLTAAGILAKYTMVLVFPVVLLALLLEPSYRPVLRRPWPYLATLVAGLGFVPILIWNAAHNWVSFRHVAGQAGLAGGSQLDLLGPFVLIGGQLAVVGPLWLAGMVAGVVTLLRRPQPGPGEARSAAGVRLLVAATLVPWLVFLVFSPLTKVQPNWPVLALLPGTIVLVAWLARLRRSPAWRRTARLLIVAGVLWGSGCVALLHYSSAAYPVLSLLARFEPPWELAPMRKYDPAARLRGWRELGAAVGRARDAAAAGGAAPFIATDDYQLASQVAFYCPGNPQVYCLQAALGRRLSQYDLWPNPISNPDPFLGRLCIFVGTLTPELTGGDGRPGAFEDIVLAERVEHRVRGHLVRIWTIYRCERFAGFVPGAGRGPRY